MRKYDQYSRRNDLPRKSNVFSNPVNSSFATNLRKSSANIANIFKVMPAKRLIQLRRTYRNSKIALAQPIRKGPGGGLLPRVMHLQAQDVSRLCDRLIINFRKVPNWDMFVTNMETKKKENIGGRTSMKQQLERLEVGAPTWQTEVGWVPEAG